MTEEHAGRATPGGEAPSSDHPLTPAEGERSASPREPGDPGELGYFTADEEAPHDESGDEPAAGREVG